MLFRFELIAIICLPFMTRAQNVGIGTTNPTRAKLEVIGAEGGGSTSAVFGAGGAGISIQQFTPSIGFNQYKDTYVAGYQGKYMFNGFAAVQYLNPTTGNFYIETFPAGLQDAFTPVGLRVLTLTSSGNLGIKTQSDNAFATLTVLRGTGVDATAIIKGTEYSTLFNYSPNEDVYLRPGRDTSIVYLNNLANGNVLLGNGTTKLFVNYLNVSGTTSTVEINQTINLYTNPPFNIYDSYDFSWGHYLSGSPFNNNWDLDFLYRNTYSISVNNMSGSLIDFSDRSAKKNILNLPDILPKLMQLNPVSYELSADNPLHQRSIGFIAQEVKNIFPEAVRVISSQNRKGSVINDLHTLSYKNFSIYAIKALQEQWKEIQEIEAEQIALEKKLDALIKRAGGE